MLSVLHTACRFWFTRASPLTLSSLDLLQDILLGLLKKLFSDPDQATRGRCVPLKVVVMSATLESDKLSAFLGDCAVFTIPGRTFPVTCCFGSAVGPKDVESTAYVKEVPTLSFALLQFSFFFFFNLCVISNEMKIFSMSPMRQVVRMALDVHTSEMAGDILVFLTGGLVERTEKTLKTRHSLNPTESVGSMMSVVNRSGGD